MPVVGDRATFAIEWRVTRRDDGRVYGHLCFWVLGERIGDFEQSVLLSAATSYLREFLSHATERHVDTLDGRRTEEVFAFVYETVYFSDSERATQDPVARSVPRHLLNEWALHGRLRATFHLDDVGDAAFQGMGVILIDDHSLDMQRLIWRDRRANDMNDLHEARLPDHVFDEVAELFLAAYAQDRDKPPVS